MKKKVWQEKLFWLLTALAAVGAAEIANVGAYFLAKQGNTVAIIGGADQPTLLYLMLSVLRDRIISGWILLVFSLPIAWLTARFIAKHSRMMIAAAVAAMVLSMTYALLYYTDIWKTLMLEKGYISWEVVFDILVLFSVTAALEAAALRLTIVRKDLAIPLRAASVGTAAILVFLIHQWPVTASRLLPGFAGAVVICAAAGAAAYGIGRLRERKRISEK